MTDGPSDASKAGTTPPPAPSAPSESPGASSVGVTDATASTTTDTAAASTTPSGSGKLPAGSGQQRFFALRLPGDAEPFAVASKTDRGAPQRWVPGHGWVDTPLIADYFTGEDPGIEEITAEQAHTYMEAGLGALGEGAVQAIRGAE